MLYQFTANYFFAKLYFQATIEHIIFFTASPVFSIISIATPQFFSVLIFQALPYIYHFILTFFDIQFHH